MSTMKKLLKYVWLIGLPAAILITAIGLTVCGWHQIGDVIKHRDLTHKGNSVDTFIAFTIFWTMSILIWGNRAINWAKGRFKTIKVKLVDGAKEVFKKEDKEEVVKQVMASDNPQITKHTQPEKKRVKGTL